MAESVKPVQQIPHRARRVYKAESPKKQDGMARRVILRSMRTLGDMIDLIYIEDVNTGDDAYLHPLRLECEGTGVFQGRYTLHKYKRRFTGQKTSDGRNYPRQVLLRLNKSDGSDRSDAVRKKVLNSVALILKQAEQNQRREKNTHLPPTVFVVDANNWDLTREELHPLSWYLTDSHVATAIHKTFDLNEIGDWATFAEHYPDDALSFFHEPYSSTAYSFGYRSANLEGHGRGMEAPGANAQEQEQEFDLNNVEQLED